MGYRTVVMLNNDLAHEWTKDPELGQLIGRAMNHAGRGEAHTRQAELKNYGEVVQCVHADTQTLAVLDGYTFFDARAMKSWTRDETPEEAALKLLKVAAAKLGYGLRKLPAEKAA